MITREQVADLRRGDVVELTDPAWHGAVLRGPLWVDSMDGLAVGVYAVRSSHGAPSDAINRTLTVISRAPRSFYVNSDRSYAEPGDVVRDGINAADDRWWWCSDVPADVQRPWLRGLGRYRRSELPERLRLLIDGTTGLPPEEAAR